MPEETKNKISSLKKNRIFFHDLKSFNKAKKGKYSLLPFNFQRFNKKKYLLSNDLGKYIFINNRDFQNFINKELKPFDEIYLDLKSKNFLSDENSSILKKSYISQYKTKKAFLIGSRKLHIFVISLRCDHSCPYCQVSRQSENKNKYDMSKNTAKKSVDLALSTPSLAMTFEFQGGEPLLNFDTIKYIVEYAKEKNLKLNKKIDFVVCTNLSKLNEEHLEYFKKEEVKVSTSLDGPDYVHDKNRPFGTKSSYESTIKNIKKTQEYLGKFNLSALMTTTKNSFPYWKEIIDEYRKHDLGNIFIRSLSPYGFAVKTEKAIGYNMDDFFNFYEKCVNYILEINKSGEVFPEAYASILLKKILTPFTIGYVDLESPAGAGFDVAVYNYDGDVYASDESRMLAEMNDKSFRLGNVYEDSYKEIFLGEKMQNIATASCNESLAGCSDCVYQPFCGADPVYHYATQKDMQGNKTSSAFCQKHLKIFRFLFKLIEHGDEDTRRILWSWANDEDHNDLKLDYKKWQTNIQ